MIGVEVDSFYSFDIDENFDFKLQELLIKKTKIYFMKKETLLITETDNFDPNTLNKLKKKFNVIFGVTSQKDLIKKLANIQYLHVRLKYFLNKDLLSYCKDLKMIFTPTTGLKSH